MIQLKQEQRQALLSKIIENFSDYQYYDSENGQIVLTDSESKITVIPQSENNNSIILELDGEQIGDNNPLWRNLPETLRARKFNLDEENKFKSQTDKNIDSQNKLNKFLGL